MRTLAASLIATALLLPQAASADRCGEEHESCVETCTIDHGMDADRSTLTRCLGRCAEKREDCRDLRGEDRNAYRRSEGPPPERSEGDRQQGGDDWTRDGDPAPQPEFVPPKETDYDDVDWAAE